MRGCALSAAKRAWNFANLFVMLCVRKREAFCAGLEWRVNRKRPVEEFGKVEIVESRRPNASRGGVRE